MQNIVAIRKPKNIYRMRHKNGWLLQPPPRKYALKFRGVYAQGWRSPWRRLVQKV